MSTMVAMEGLWQYLRTLPRSNKQWLSERLQEDLHPKAATTDCEQLKPDINKSFARCTRASLSHCT